MKWAGGLDGLKLSFHTGSRRSQPPLAFAVPLSRLTSRVGGGSAFYVRQQDTTQNMNTSTLPSLIKTLRALSVLFASLGVFWISIPLVTGIHWQNYVQGTLKFALVAIVLFSCYRYSRHDKRSSLATALLWFLVLATGIYGAIFLFGLLRVMIQH
jgi:hypothetical protein